MGGIGIALSGGGARGICHLGVLKAIDEKNLNIEIISGTSAGSVAGAFYAQGYSPDEILEIILSTSFIKFLKPVVIRGLLDISKVGEIFKSYLSHNSFSKLKIPLVIAATNLKEGNTSYFSSGELIGPLLASCCVPVIFKPYEYKGVSYVDGGILNNLPTEPLVDKCDIIIGSSCNAIDDNFESTGVRKIVERSLLMAIGGNTMNSRKHCSLFIEPPGLSKISGFELKRAKEIYNIGYEFALEKLSEAGY